MRELTTTALFIFGMILLLGSAIGYVYLNRQIEIAATPINRYEMPDAVCYLSVTEGAAALSCIPKTEEIKK